LGTAIGLKEESANKVPSHDNEDIKRELLARIEKKFETGDHELGQQLGSKFRLQ